MKTIRYLVFLALIVGILGEGLTRLLIPEAPKKSSADILTDHPYLRCEWAPNFTAVYNVDGIGAQKGEIPFKINAFGFRSSSMTTAEKPAGTYRIFFLGASTTESAVIREEETFPFLVEKKLDSLLPGKRFECVNAGISSAIAPDILATLIYKVMYYEPDTVIYMQAINDLRYGALPVYDPVRRPTYRKKTNGSSLSDEARDLIRRILKYSRFLTLLKRNLLNRFFPPEDERFKTKMEEYNDLRNQRLHHPFTPIPESASLTDYRKYLEEMIFIARAHKVRLIFMTEPSIYLENLPADIDRKLWMGYFEKYGVNLSNEFLAREMARFNDTLRQLALSYGVELIDLEKKMPKDLAHFYDDVHLTPEGSKRAAEIIGDYLAKQPG